MRLISNVGKTKIIHLKRRPLVNDNLTDYTLNIQTVEAVPVCKYLKLLIDANHNWSAHITWLYNKIGFMSGALSKLKRFLPKSILMKIYFALVHSQFHQVQVLHKRCLKHVCRLEQRHFTADLFTNDCKGVLNVNTLFKFNVCLL